MKELRLDATLSDEQGASAGPALDAAAPASLPVPASAALHEDVVEFAVASHDALFTETPANRCDACGDPLTHADDVEGYGLPGHGVYLWARGDATRLESVPLCASCASAIGMTALARWEIEEEEG